jgi:hypothetical protein
MTPTLSEAPSRKSGRSRKPGLKPVLLYMPEELVARLDRAKDQDRRTRSAEIFHLLELALDTRAIA